MKDIIAEADNRPLREAKGNVNNEKVLLQLEAANSGIGGYVGCWNGGKYRCEYFFTLFFALRYYKKLVKKYGLIEKEVRE